jgi:DNA invertase Pin-like site-specific DNA recombinase
MLIGYARVSTQDQNLELQQEPLIAVGCEGIFDGEVIDEDLGTLWEVMDSINANKASGQFFCNG